MIDFTVKFSINSGKTEMNWYSADATSLTYLTLSFPELSGRDLNFLSYSNNM